MAETAVRPGPWWFAPEYSSDEDNPTSVLLRDGRDRKLQKYVEDAVLGRMDDDEFVSWELFQKFVIDVKNPPMYPPEEEGGEPEPVKIEFDETTGELTEDSMYAFSMTFRLLTGKAIGDRLSLAETDRKNSVSRSPSTRDERTETADSVEKEASP